MEDLHVVADALDLGVLDLVVEGLERLALQAVEEPDADGRQHVEGDDGPQTRAEDLVLGEAEEEEEEAHLDGELHPDVDELLGKEALERVLEQPSTSTVVGGYLP
jgi:hypothetical protein